ncbi:MAG: putative dsRNA-binding protein [Candidatus Poribacteria bacterium]|nr:putative dsRNA-binding protein [Candidatus Poribacteria bacterium]
MTKPPLNRPDFATDSFNPTRGQLQSMQECLEQLHEALPASKAEYVNADRMTHALVKSCFLMLVQRAIDTNSVVIETGGKRPPYQKLQTFIAVWSAGAIADETLEFFKEALDYRQKMVADEDLSDAQIYAISQGILKHGQGYVNQVRGFFAKPPDPPEPAAKKRAQRTAKLKAAPDTADELAALERSTSQESPELGGDEPSSKNKNGEKLKENYKGALQTLCMRRGLGPPSYHTEQRGTPHQPLWRVMVQYGEHAHTTPSSISGSKKHAEQIAAKQVIELFDNQPTPNSASPQSEDVEIPAEIPSEMRFEATQALREAEPIDVQTETEQFSREIEGKPLQVSPTLILQILGLANDWLARSKRGETYLQMLDTPEVRGLIGLDLADLTFRWARAFLESADRHQIEILDPPEADD